MAEELGTGVFGGTGTLAVDTLWMRIVTQPTVPPGGQSCSTCKFYQRSPQFRAPAAASYVCMAYPPTMVQSHNMGTYYPNVDANDWCGAWVTK